MERPHTPECLVSLLGSEGAVICFVKEKFSVAMLGTKFAFCYGVLSMGIFFRQEAL